MTLLIKPWEVVCCPYGHKVAIAVRAVYSDMNLDEFKGAFVPLTEFPIGDSYSCRQCGMGVFNFAMPPSQGIRYMKLG